MTLLPATSGTEPETRPLGSVSLSFQTRPLGSVSLSFQTRPLGSVSLSFQTRPYRTTRIATAGSNALS